MPENMVDQGSEQSRVRMSLEVNALIWFDRRDNVWRGLVRELSLFAEGTSAMQVEETLKQLSHDYIMDAIENDLVAEMIPRSVPRLEWLKLTVYSNWLSVREFMSRVIHRRRDGDRPVQHRLIPC